MGCYGVRDIAIESGMDFGLKYDDLIEAGRRFCQLPQQKRFEKSHTFWWRFLVNQGERVLGMGPVIFGTHAR